MQVTGLAQLAEPDLTAMRGIIAPDSGVPPALATSEMGPLQQQLYSIQERARVVR